MRKKLTRIGIVLASVVALVLGAVTPAFADTYDEITVTATPAFIGISITQNTWTINGIDLTGVIAPATTYYSNADGASGDVTAPSATVLAAECYFEVTNASTIVTDLTANMVDFTGGDAMANSDGGYADAEAGEFGASTYIEGASWPGDAVILKKAASAAMKVDLAATTDQKFGVALKTQSDAWTSGDAMTSTITVTATDST
jgi:hypothetical protein